MMADSLSNVLSCSADDLLDLGPAGTVAPALRSGCVPVARKNDYLIDRRYTGQFDENPFHAGPEREPHQPVKSVTICRPASGAMVAHESIFENSTRQSAIPFQSRSHATI